MPGSDAFGPSWSPSADSVADVRNIGRAVWEDPEQRSCARHAEPRRGCGGSPSMMVCGEWESVGSVQPAGTSIPTRPPCPSRPSRVLGYSAKPIAPLASKSFAAKRKGKIAGTADIMSSTLSCSAAPATIAKWKPLTCATNSSHAAHRLPLHPCREVQSPKIPFSKQPNAHLPGLIFLATGVALSHAGT